MSGIAQPVVASRFAGECPVPALPAYALPGRALKDAR